MFEPLKINSLSDLGGEGSDQSGVQHESIMLHDFDFEVSFNSVGASNRKKMPGSASNIMHHSNIYQNMWTMDNFLTHHQDK